MLKKIRKKSWFMAVVILVVSFALSGGIIAYKNLNQKALNQASAGNGFTYECDSSKPDSIECMQKTYSDTVRTKGIKEAFQKLRTDYSTSNAVQANCHQITHAIGREAVSKYKTIQASFDQGDNFCWSGYYHGVMEAVAKDLGKDQINNSLNIICAKVAATRKYSFYHFNCVHGLGHGLMAVNEDNLFEVLKLCDNFNDNWESRSCYGGAFMENIMASIQSGENGKYLKSDDPMYPCTAVADKYKSDCYLMQTSQALRVVGNDYAKVFNLCAQTPNYAEVCYQSLGRDASGNSTSNVERTTSVCMLGATETARENCFVGAVKDFISYYHGDTEAKQLCGSLESSLRTICDSTREEYMKTL